MDITMPRYIDAYALQERLSDCEFETNCVSEDNKKEILKILRIFIPQIIASEPTVDAEPVRHGKWIRTDDNETRCSECGDFSPIKYDWSEDLTNYCPNCGAKMDGDNNG